MSLMIGNQKHCRNYLLGKRYTEKRLQLNKIGSIHEFVFIESIFVLPLIVEKQKQKHGKTAAIIIMNGLELNDVCAATMLNVNRAIFVSEKLNEIG